MYRKFLRNKELIFSSMAGFALLIVSLFINFYAGVYATEKASNSVTDIILSNTKAFDLDEIFIYGSWLLVIIIAVICFRRPWKMPFIFKAIAIWVLVRAVFLTLTHIGPVPTPVVINPSSFLSYFVFGGDLFFSGHTGLPYLMALILWDDKKLRYVFIFLSMFMGVVVLLAHLHYTIDVLSAYFITYGVFQIEKKAFKKDYALNQENLLEAI